MPAYKMTAYPRGLALIIEIEEFVNNVEKPRIGSHVSYYFKKLWRVSLIKRIPVWADHYTLYFRDTYCKKIIDLEKESESLRSTNHNLKICMEEHKRTFDVITSFIFTVITNCFWWKTFWLSVTVCFKIFDNKIFLISDTYKTT